MCIRDRCYRLFSITDDQIVGVQGELLLVQRDDLFAFVGAAYINGAAGDLSLIHI